MLNNPAATLTAVAIDWEEAMITRRLTNPAHAFDGDQSTPVFLRLSDV